MHVHMHYMYTHAHNTCSVKRLWHSWPSLFYFLFRGSRSHLRNLRDFKHPPPSLRSIAASLKHRQP